MKTVSSELSTRELYVSLLRDERMVSVALISLFATMGMNVVTPVLPAIADGLAVSDSRIGLVVTVYSLFAMVLVPVTGVLADMYGRRTVLLPSIVGYGLAGTVIFFVTTFEALLLLRAVQGAAFAAIMPITVTLIGDFYSGGSGSAAQGFRTAANGIGSSLVPLVAGILAGIAWNVPFLLYLIFIPMFVMVYRYLPEPTNEFDSSNPGRATSDIVQTVRTYLRAIRNELTSIELGVLVSGECVRDFVRYGLLTFIPIFAVRAMGASFAEAGAVLAARGIVYITLSPLSGAIVNRFSRKHVMVGGLLISAASTIAMVSAPSVFWLAVLLGIYTIGDSVFAPVIKDSVTSLSSDRRRGGIVSTMNMLKYGGQTAAPAFFGLVLAVLGFEFIFIIGAGITSGYILVLIVTIGKL